MDSYLIKQLVQQESVKEIIKKYPYTANFFQAIRLEVLDDTHTLAQIANAVPEDYFKEYGLNRVKFVESFITFIEDIERQVEEEMTPITSLTIVGGVNKRGDRENQEVTIHQGEIVCIVGPTGSGKSRLLGDIECLAQGDTPTQRKILIEGKAPSEEKRYNLENHLVAQLSQNMNFVMDLSVEAFVKLHAESRMIENVEAITEEIIASANELAGERFSKSTTVTQLSGGQSRALMIADTALLSSSPIILIDEIENAGIDRRKALDILVKKEKIVMMSTHDPILALMGDKRIVIQNGGIKEVIVTDEQERKNIPFLNYMDSELNKLRNCIRQGEKIIFNVNDQFIRGLRH